MRPVRSFASLALAATLVALAAAAPLPTAAQGAPRAAPGNVSGQVQEVIQSGAYTYLRLKTPSGEIWAAVTAVEVAQGQQVTVLNPMTMERFESKALKRSFDKILFGELADAKPRTAAATGPAAPTPGAGAGPRAAQEVHAAPGAAPAKPVARLPKAGGAEGRTVAEVTGGKAKLKDKTVAVRGQVVKVSLGILGKNWLHLQDGTGSAADGSNDLLVTTQGQPKIGDVVVARGKVRTDVTVGSGYTYAVMIEDATLGK